MAIQTCPTDVFGAEPERVWDLLTRPDELVKWVGARVVEAPARALREGDRVVLAPGFGMRATLEVRGMERPRHLTLDVGLPFGVVNHERIEVSALDGGRCRVTLN